MTAKQTGVRGKVREGTVVSDKMQKTVVVAIESNFRHRLYKKTVRRVRRFMVHDETEDAKLGDRVRIVETSPVSRRKRWRLLDVLIKAELPEVAPESIDLELLGEVKPEEPEVEAAAAEPEESAEAEEPVPAEAVSSPEAEAVIPEEVEVAEEVPDIEPAVEEQPSQDIEPEAEAEPEAFVEPVEEPEAEAEPEEAPAADKTVGEEKSS
jgi:small subunit ribosomal protein S17